MILGIDHGRVPIEWWLRDAGEDSGQRNGVTAQQLEWVETWKWDWTGGDGRCECDDDDDEVRQHGKQNQINLKAWKILICRTCLRNVIGWTSFEREQPTRAETTYLYAHENLICKTLSNRNGAAIHFMQSTH